MAIFVTMWVILGALLAPFLFSKIRWWPIVWLLFAIWVFYGLVLLAISLWRMRRPALRGVAVRSAAAILAMGVLFFPLSMFFDRASKWLRFKRERATYERVVDRIQGEPASSGLRESDGQRYIVDAGPPVRVAFVWWDSGSDRWCGAVFDPTREVLRINQGLPTRGTAEWHSHSLRRLFGGSMRTCRSLDEHYFHCCFS